MIPLRASIRAERVGVYELVYISEKYRFTPSFDSIGPAAWRGSEQNADGWTPRIAQRSRVCAGFLLPDDLPTRTVLEAQSRASADSGWSPVNILSESPTVIPLVQSSG